MFLVLVLAYITLSRWLYTSGLGSRATVLVVSGFLVLVVVGAMLYYGARQSAMTRRLDSETDRADTEKQMVERLQTAFLQQRLPIVSNLGFSATYIPAASGALVGGDWYDAFELPHGKIMFSIGDVAGHGIESAVTMSRARQAIIAAALHDSDPSAVLARANLTLLLQGTEFATAICGYVDPASLEVTYATAGHPPAIMVDPDGETRLLDYDGPPLGVTKNARYRTFRVEAKPDSLLVLYTDGLIEYDHNIIEGERRMLATAREIALRRATNPADAIQDAIFAANKPLDDVAILTLEFRDASIDRDQPWSVGLRGVRAPFSQESHDAVKLRRLSPQST